MGKGLFGRLQDEVTVREKMPGLDMGNILELPDGTRETIVWMLRETQVDLPQLAVYLGKDEDSARATVNALVAQGYVRMIDIKGQVHYRVRLKPKRKHNMPPDLWKALEDKADQEL